MVAPFFDVFFNELMGISIWRMSVFLIIRNIDNTILSTGTRPNHTFAVLAFAFFIFFASRGYILVAGVGPNECWLFVEYHHYNFVTTSSPILRNTILSTGTRPNPYFLVCFLVVFLIFLDLF